jgi:hypothetical protein
MSKNKRFYEDRSQYLVGLGSGILLAGLSLIPTGNVSIPRDNIIAIVMGALIMIAGGVYGSFAARKH